MKISKNKVIITMCVKLAMVSTIIFSIPNRKKNNKHTLNSFSMIHKCVTNRHEANDTLLAKK